MKIRLYISEKGNIGKLINFGYGTRIHDVELTRLGFFHGKSCLMKGKL